ncbi:UvrD-helicase domain-containing protein [Baia soyae]|uniref:DNA 3'-5' helicase n=1 Tax=Baia soyae TaxID=1544746 RepID=A0A4R2RUD2_9BACL|nr:UvrD-helicase domain-containing protein [Baia soyae]TCP66267.1 ATP-dependent exoDNAse (exonuclease V) beta subunit [Baia soyae]
MEKWMEELICESLSEEQKEAVLSKQYRCIVMAGAGAGKTRVLVKRFVYTLCQFGMNPSNLRKMVAITFTKKAATEMRDRLRKEMERMIDRLGKRGDEAEVQSWNEVRQCLDEAHIYTIHSYCQLILSTEPIRAGVDPFFQVVEEWEANRLLEQAVIHVLSSTELLHQRSEIEREWWMYYLSLIGWTRAESMLVELSRKWRNLGWTFSKLVDCTTESLLHRLGSDDSEKEHEMNLESEEMMTRLLLFYLQEIHVYYQLLKQQKARYDYQDLIQMVCEALEKDPSFRVHIKQQIQSLMIDEYQDTDGLQKRLVDFIIAEQVDAYRYVFVVGDPKQSIYRFRGADVSIFIETQKEWMDEENGCLHLTHNYRSQAGIVQFSNQLCKHAFPVDEFRPIQASRTGKGIDIDKPVQLLCISNKDRNNEKLVEQEAMIISNQIKRLRSDFRYGDMVLLLRKMNDASLYEQILRSQGLPVRIVGGSSFYETQEIQDFLYLLATILTPARAENWVGALRSPFVHMSDEGITRLALRTGWTGDPRSWLNQSILKEHDQLRLRNFCSLYESLKRMSLRRTPGQLIRWIMEHSNYMTILWGLPNGAQAAFNLEKWCSTWEIESDPTLLTLEGFLEKMELYQSEANQEPEAEIWDEGEDVIRIMTIHKSKGLEFPIVFLPNLWNTSHVPVSRESSLIHPTMGLVIKGFDHLERQSYAKSKIEFPRWKEAVFYEEELESQELMRLLYVAVTRAEDTLFLGLPENQGKSTSTKDLASWLRGILTMDSDEPRESIPFGSDFLPILYENTFSITPPLVEGERKSDPFDHTAISFTEPIPFGKYNHIPISVTDWKELVHCPRKYYYHRVLQVPIPDVERVEEKPSVSYISGNRRGEIVHYLCEKTVSSAERLWLQPDWFARIAHIFHLNSREMEALQPDLEQIRTRFLDSHVVQRIAESKKVLTEEPFQFVTPGFRISGQIDLLLQDQHQGWEIIDFKTDRMKVEDITEKKTFYLPQLQLYSLAWRARGMQINGATLYFLDCNHEERIQIDSQWWQQAERLLEYTRSFFPLERKMFNWPTKPSKNCSYCEYNVLCDKIGTNS